MTRLDEHEEDGGYHRLDWELRLRFSDGSMRVFSWVNEPVQHCIGSSDKSFLREPLERLILRDVSQTRFWRGLLGTSITLEYVDSGNQVLRIYGGESEVFLSSQYADGMFTGDCVRISLTQPHRESQ